MIPPPIGRHALALAILGAAAVLTGLMAAHESTPTNDQVNAAVNALRATQAGLYERDPVFGREGLWQYHSPAWQWYLREVFAATGYTDIIAPFRTLAGPLTFVYLLGMYALLWQQVRSWSVACIVAILSMRVINVPGGGFWGLGPLQTMNAESVVLAAALGLCAD